MTIPCVVEIMRVMEANTYTHYISNLRVRKVCSHLDICLLDKPCMPIRISHLDLDNFNLSIGAFQRNMVTRFLYVYFACTAEVEPVVCLLLLGV